VTVSRQLAVALAIGATLLVAPAATTLAASPSVDITGKGFAPKAVTVTAGKVVTWQNTTSTAHTVTADDGSFDSGPLALNDQFANAFISPGTYPYHCSIHPAMTGVVVVKASKPTPTPKGPPPPTPPSGTLPPELTTPAPVSSPTPSPEPPAASTPATAAPAASEGVAPTAAASQVASDAGQGGAAAGSTGGPGLLSAGILAVAVVVILGGLLLVRRRRDRRP
jgi:plastocyanin